jgi:hypothetical protein
MGNHDFVGKAPTIVREIFGRNYNPFIDVERFSSAVKSYSDSHRGIIPGGTVNQYALINDMSGSKEHLSKVFEDAHTVMRFLKYEAREIGWVKGRWAISDDDPLPF